MRALEEKAFAGGVSAEELMEKAGRGIAEAVARRYPVPGKLVACIGSGNNGGDALVAARYLRDAGWRIGVRCAVDDNKLGALPRKKWRELGEVEESRGVVAGCRLILDGLLGIGAQGGLREPLLSCAQWINEQRSRRDTDVIAMDIPSGVDGDTGEPYEGAVVADLTLTVGVPKRGLLVPAAVNHTGAVETVPLEELPLPVAGDLVLNDVFSLRGVLPRRAHDFHKGDAGRVAVVAGSRGMLGAAVLGATGALRAGAGLVSLLVDEDIYGLVVPMVPPEVMVRPVGSWSEVMLEGFDALVLGPGIGPGVEGEQQDVLDLMLAAGLPLVIDADGLNRLASLGRVGDLAEGTVVTPHPGEMNRIFPEAMELPREEGARQFVERYPEVVLLLKGARTLLGRSGSPLFVNGTGHAGMASGGQGDVLAGVIGGLLGQGVGPLDAARLGAWLCGRAAELACGHDGQSQESLLATDVADHLGLAFGELV